MHRTLLTAVSFFMLATSGHAQSSLSLESFDLGTGSTEAITPSPSSTSSLGDCLLASAECEDTQMRAGVTLSLEDVQNLKVESNAGTSIIPASTNVSPSQASVPLPSIDMEILFDYNSDTVRPDQMSRLFELGAVLKEDRFSEFSFLFVGHSDAKGSASYNQDLSARRARAVADFVQASAHMSQENFAASGMGFSHLKDRNDPYGAQNRRVQLVLVPKSN